MHLLAIDFLANQNALSDNMGRKSRSRPKHRNHALQPSLHNLANSYHGNFCNLHLVEYKFPQTTPPFFSLRNKFYRTSLFAPKIHEKAGTRWQQPLKIA